MRAMSLKDAAAAVSDRPDRRPDRRMTAGWRDCKYDVAVGFLNDAFDFYCRTGGKTKEGLACASSGILRAEPVMMRCVRGIAEREGCMEGNVLSGAAFADVVVSTFLVSRHRWMEKLLADPQTPRPFTGKLLNVHYGQKVHHQRGKIRR